MNVYSLFPLIATVVYIPLLATTLSSRPWQRRHTLFTLFLISAMMWSLIDYFARSNFFPQYNDLLLKVVVIIFSVMAIQFHLFTSSFFAPGQRRWLPFAYASLAVIIALVVLGYVPQGVEIVGDKHYPDYGIGVIIIAVPLLTLAARNFYVFWKRLKTLDNPVLYNQIISLLLTLSILVIFTLTIFLPWGKDYPISHFGNLINAFVLSYAVIQHQLVDIKIVVRRGLALVSLLAIGAVSYWLLLVVLHTLFDFELSATATAVATIAAIVVAIFIYRLRGSLVALISRGFQGQSYDYRRALSDFSSKIHNVFSLKEQGGELLALVTKAIDCKQACLLFPESGSQSFTTQLTEPQAANPLASLKIEANSPIVEYLNHEQKPLTRENLSILPEFRSLWEQEKEEIRKQEIELFMPLISRERLIAILVLGKRQSGRYSLEDFNLLEEVTNRVAVSMEKEYLREQLRQREEELSLLNRSSAIITSSLDIQEIFDSFIGELKKLIDVHWASIILVEENELHVLALSSRADPNFHLEDRMPIQGSFTEWVVTHKKPLVEPDLAQRTSVTIGEYHGKQGIRSVACLPLITEGEAIGSLIITSRKPNALSQQHVKLLEQLTSQIAIAVENAQLYAKAEEQARIDEVTGLLNRRSLDEMIASEIGRHSRYGGIFSLLILDLDSFKVFNDKYGHLAGDGILRQVGNTMKNAIRSADQAFRYGGDEFAILLPQTNVDAAHRVAERVRKQVAAKVKGGDIPITASLGLATWPADGISTNEIIVAADTALYRAKGNGGNQIQCAIGSLLPLDDMMASPESKVESSGSLSTIYALAATVDARDHYTSAHSKKVIEYSLAIAEALHLEPWEMNRLENCALLHDIGKIGVSDEILNKPGKLTAAEWEVIKAHPQLGAAIVNQAPELATCTAGILYHHERHDGSGYPKGLRGEEIPLEARILAIADAFAAMTSVRPYATALSHDSALEEIKQGAGTQFDPYLVEVFLTTVNTAVPLNKKRAGGGKA